MNFMVKYDEMCNSLIEIGVEDLEKSRFLKLFELLRGTLKQFVEERLPVTPAPAMSIPIDLIDSRWSTPTLYKKDSKGLERL